MQALTEIAAPILGHSDVREAALRDGYVFVTDLLPEAVVDAARTCVLEAFREAGVLITAPHDAAPVVRANTTVMERPSPEWLSLYFAIQRDRRLYGILECAELHAAARLIARDDIFFHSRVIVRVFANYPVEHATPPHRDVSWTGGSQRSWTVWVPLVTIDRSLGGLVLLPRSHRRAVPTRGPDERSGFEFDGSEEWHTAPTYEPGDVVIFDGRLVHAGLGTSVPDRLRLSLEIRFQPLADAVRRDCMEPHWAEHGLTWDDVYAGWDEADPLRRYWEALGVTVVGHEEAGGFQQDLRSRYLLNVMRSQLSVPDARAGTGAVDQAGATVTS